MRKLSVSISTGWNSRFQHSGLSARLICTLRSAHSPRDTAIAQDKDPEVLGQGHMAGQQL